MTIDSEPRVGQPSAEAVRTTKTGGGTPSKPLAPGLRPGPPTWMQQSVLTAVAGGIIGYLVGPLAGQPDCEQLRQRPGQWAKRRRYKPGPRVHGPGLARGRRRAQLPPSQDNRPGAAPRHPQAELDALLPLHPGPQGCGHPVPGGVFTFLFTGGLLAMGIRTELLTPASHFFGPGTYIDIVGEHGTIMMMMASSVVVGPLGNYLVPLMIGSRRTAFPRVEAASLWVFCRRVFRDPDRPALRRVPNGLDRLRARCRPKVPEAWTRT